MARNKFLRTCVIYLILKYWDENTRGMENVRVKKKKKKIFDRLRTRQNDR